MLQTTKQAKERTDITTISICPGNLQTGTSTSGVRVRSRYIGQRTVTCALLTADTFARVDLGGPMASIPVSVGVRGVLKVVGSLTPKDSGLFFNAQGERVQW